MTNEEKKAINYFNADVEFLEEGLKNPNYKEIYFRKVEEKNEWTKEIMSWMQL